MSFQEDYDDYLGWRADREQNTEPEHYDAWLAEQSRLRLLDAVVELLAQNAPETAKELLRKEGYAV